MRAVLAVVLVACSPASSGDAVDASSETADATPRADAAADAASTDAPGSATNMICTPTLPSTGVLDPDCII